MDSAKNFWAGKSVFITGIGGFVGVWLARSLADLGASVVGLIRDFQIPNKLRLFGLDKKVHVVFGALEDFGLLFRVLGEYRIDTCFHLAAQTIVGTAKGAPLSTFESNVRGTWNVLEACRLVPGVQRIVVASSDKAYGNHHGRLYEEAFCLNGLATYEASKACADVIARSYATAFHLPISITRCANIYGGSDFNYSRIVPGTARAIWEGVPPVIRTDGTPVRNYIYIKDVVAAYLKLAECTHLDTIRGQSFNIGSSSSVSVLDLVNRMIALSDHPHLSPTVFGQHDAVAEIDQQRVSSAKAKRLLGWKAQYSLDQGLAETLRWYFSHWDSEKADHGDSQRQ